jgi:sugar phosphate permease
MTGTTNPGRARWWRVLPIVFVTYSLAYVDRANYGFAAAAGMAGELGISASTSALIGALFALGYCVFQIPGVAWAQRHSVKRLVFGCLLVWGLFATLTGVVSSVPALLVVRFGLGVAEAAVMPAMLLYVSQWFSRAERSRANSLLILGGPVTVLWMSVLSGYLIEAVGWRGMFIAEGLPTVLWALVWWWTVCERPEDAGWLAPDEKAALSARLRDEARTVAPVGTLRAAIRHPAVVVMAAQYFFWSLSFFGFVLWLPSILREASAFGIVQTGWLAATPYLVAVGAMLAVSWCSDRTGARRCYVWRSLLVGAVAFGGLYFTMGSRFWLSFALLVVAGAAMYAPYGPFWAIVPEVLPANVAGGAIAFINSIGSLGAFVGGYAVGALSAVTGTPLASFLLMAFALAVSAGLTPWLPESRAEAASAS